MGSHLEVEELSATVTDEEQHVQGLEAEGLDHHGPPVSWRSTTFFTVLCVVPHKRAAAR